ncbi:MAG: HAD-IB family phosphatase [Candidatus Methylacidiphilales bacterium]|nr:HAD-IB family phosphatase [Candidatus Methylacidiphilales bacterium]
MPVTDPIHTPVKVVVFDCDSTLSSIEGIDELARDAGPEIFREVESMTRLAMEGAIPLEDVFRRRLELIRPGAAACAAIAQKYLQTIEPDAGRVLAELRGAGWTPAILSGGLAPAVQPLAAHLGITEVHAVPLYFDEAGNYLGFDAEFPAARSGGKPLVIQQLRARLGAGKVVMVGDGASDLETKPVVDLFVGFGRYADRPAVRAGAGAFLMELAGLPQLLARL